MKRLLVLMAVVASVWMIVSGTAFAQEPEAKGIEVANLFTWARETPPAWGRGALLAGLGLVGALVTMFGLIGGAVPGTAGQAKIDAEAARLSDLYKRLEELIKAPSVEANDVEAVEKVVNNLRDDLREERWRQFLIAAIFYAVLGAFFSALLAQDMLQALLIGAGWTGYVGSLGLKRDYAERASEKDNALEKSETTLEELRRLLESQQKAIRRIQEKQAETEEEQPPLDLSALGVATARPLPEVRDDIAQAPQARDL